MGFEYIFRSLKIYSDRETKYTTRKLVYNDFGVTFPGTNGECLTLAMMYVKEKFTKPDFEYFKDQRETNGGNIHRFNLGSFGMAYRLERQTTPGDYSPIERSVGVSPWIRPSLDHIDRELSDIGLATVITKHIEGLEKVSAAIFELRFSPSQVCHTIAVYKSRSNHFHVFDSTTGVYRIKNNMHEPFFHCLIQQYQVGKGVTLEPNGLGSIGWVHYYKP